MEISALAEHIVKALVDYPELVFIKEKKGISSSILELGVHKTDIGKVIGKKGAAITALRTILSAAAGKEKRNITVELIE